MPVITEIKEQVRHANRRSVFLDGRYAFSLTVDELVEHRLTVGQNLSAEQVEALSEALELRRAKEALYRLLGYRARSESELRGRLRRKQFAEPVIDRALADLRQQGLVDDRQFAEAWVSNRLSTGRAGRTRLAWELRARGIERQVAEESLAQISEAEEFPFALEVAERRYERLRGEEPEALRRKLASFLMRRGFSYDTIDRVLTKILPPD